MIVEILKGTPIWVWIILYFLVRRGVGALQTREVSMVKVLLMPLIMVYFSITGTRSYEFYIIGVLLGLIVGMVIYMRANIQVNKKTKTVILQGSKIPLILMLSTFIFKYCTNVAVAITPALLHQMSFVITVTTVSGILGGLFLARIIVIVKQFVA